MMNKKSRILFLLFLLIVLIISFFILKNNRNKIEKFEESRFSFGTYIKIQIYEKKSEEKRVKEIINKTFDEIDRIDKKFNSKQENSLISDLNKNRKIIFDEEGLYLLSEINKVYTLTNGKYDITMAPLMKVWGFTEEKEITSIPTEKEIEEALKKVDYSKIDIQGNEIILLLKEMELDTGSFLKGFAIEKGREILKENGIKNAYITAISSIGAVNGKIIDGKEESWKIGIQNPNNPTEILGIVELNDKSMGVSGDYQTFVEIEGKKYHHILDKETGYPVTDKKMVVVISDNTFIADLYSTAFFLMPVDEIIKFVNSKDNIDVLVVDKNNEIYLSKNMNFIKISK